MADLLDDDRNSSADSDFFSPISASFFRPKSGVVNNSAGRAAPSSSSSQQQHRHRGEPQGSGEKLPPLHDSSWIGARLSPIGQSFDNESVDDDNNNEEEEENFTTVYHRALHESFENADFIIAGAATPSGRVHANERTRLLSMRPTTTAASGAAMKQAHFGGRGRRAVPGNFASNHNARGGGGGGLHIGGTASNIHPLWDQKGPPNGAGTLSPASDSSGFRISWGGLVCAASGVCFVAMAVADYVEYYQATTNGTDSERYSNGTALDSSQWSLPWIRPSSTTMYEFGAFVPELDWEFPIRIVTSSFLCSSVVEYAVVLVAWRLVSKIREPSSLAAMEPWHRWSGMYAASCVVGQLWMTAWDGTNGAITGCVAWSTCGVLIYVGMQSLSRRLVFFCTAAVLLLLSLFQRPYSSVVGTVGACSLGWSLAAAEVTTVPYWPPQRRSYHDKIAAHSKPSWLCWIGRVLAVNIVVLPTLYISFLY